MPERAAGAAGFVAPGRATAAGRPEFMGRLYLYDQYGLQVSRYSLTDETVFAAFLTLGFRGGIGFDTGQSQSESSLQL